MFYISGDGKYCLVGTGIVGTAHLYNSIKTTPKSEEWKQFEGSNVNDVAISGFGSYFAVVDYGNDILYLFHRSIPLPRLPIIGDDDDDDEELPVISYGNYYLIFAVISIISLILVVKRKIIFTKR